MPKCFLMAPPVVVDNLEWLCRYIARPAVSNERHSVNDHGQVVYHQPVYRLKHPFHDGTTHVVAQWIQATSRDSCTNVFRPATLTCSARG